jgi:acyl-coenzyme A thioesterase PaaI-like protein
MNKSLFKYLDILFTKSENRTGLIALQKLFLIGIPFNKPHGIKFKKLTQFESVLELANKRANHNHLGGIHACAIATLGEFSAGLLLCKNFATFRYRIIMKDLHVEFYKQGRSVLSSAAQITTDQIDAILRQLQSDVKADIELQTNIFNGQNELIAKVTTKWQLKDWAQTQSIK